MFKLGQSSLNRVSFFRSKLFSNYNQKERLFNDIFVVGAGCIGQGIAASLLKSNITNRIFLITSPKYMAKIQESGINVSGALQERFLPNERLIIRDTINKDFILENNISEDPSVFLATKAHDAVASLKSIRDLLVLRKSTVVCLQNGLGVEKDIKLSTGLFDAVVLKGQVFGAIHQKGNAIFAYKGDIIVEKNEINERNLHKIFGNKDSSIFNLLISPNILQSIFPKIAVNCVCNPLTVIFNKNLGNLRVCHEGLIKSICDEIHSVAVAQGIDFGSSDYLTNVVLETMERYSEHYSSMYLDIVAGKKTEIDQINGAILQISFEKGIHTPVNKLLLKSVKEIEEKRFSYTSANGFYKDCTSYLIDLQRQLLSFDAQTAINLYGNSRR